MSRASIRLDRRLLELSFRLTERDRCIVRAVRRHRVLTTDQIARMFFDSEVRARHRLVRLHRLEILERFRRAPRGPFHYVLGELGAVLVAHENDEDPSRVTWRKDHALAIGKSQRLDHYLGVNNIAADLTQRARTGDDSRLWEWWPERQATRWAEDGVRPDARVLWEEHGQRCEFFLEYDRGTETLQRLAKKLGDYRWLEEMRAVSAPVVFVLPSAEREANAREVMADTDVPVATGVRNQGARAHQALWLPVFRPWRRLRLAELADHPKPPAAETRVASGGIRTGPYRSVFDDILAGGE